MAVQREQVVQTAEKYVSRGKIEPAIREYRKLLADNPNDINTLNRIGDLYARIQRIDEAVDFFTQIAEQYSTEGFFVKAIAIYKKIIKLDPTRLEVYEKLAELYHKQGLVNEARTQYQVLADYYQKHDNAASAIAIYQKMADLEPANPSYHVKLAEIYQRQQLIEKAMSEYRIIAEMMISHGRSQDAAQVYERALDIDSSNLGFIQDALLRLRESGNAAAAARFLSIATERNPQAARFGRLAPAEEPEPAPAAAPPPRPAAPPPVEEDWAPEPEIYNSSYPEIEIEIEDGEAPAAGEPEAVEAGSDYEDDVAAALRAAEASLLSGPDRYSAVPAAAAEPQASSLEAEEIELDLDGSFVLDIDEDDEPSSLVKPPPDMTGTGLRLGSAWGGGSAAAPAAEEAEEEVEEAPPPAASALPVPEELPEIDLEMEIDFGSFEAEPEPAHPEPEPVQVSAPAAPSAPVPPEPAGLPGLEGDDRFFFELEEELPPLDTPSWTVEPEPAPEPEPALHIDADLLERTAAELHPRPVERDEDLVSEAEVLAKYGLEEKALERLREALRIRPQNLGAYAQMIQIHLEKGRHDRVLDLANTMSRTAAEAGDPHDVWVKTRRQLASAGYRIDGDRVVTGPHGAVAPVPPPAPPPPAAAAAPAPAPQSPPRKKPTGDLDQMLRGLLDDRRVRPARPAAAPPPPAAPPPSPVLPPVAAAPAPAPPAAPAPLPAPPAAPRPGLFNPLEIGEMIEREEMDWDEPVAGPGLPPLQPLPAPGSSPEGGFGPGLDDTGGMSWLDEAERVRPPKEAQAESLFDEEDDFFDLAAELEQELSEDVFHPGADGMVQPAAEQSLEEIVEGFKKGVAEHLSPTDYDTHFNLGIAYREMGLLDEAIGEFQVAAKDPGHLVLCCSMLGLCFLDKGLPELAVKWYRRGLDAPGLAEEDNLGLHYDLGCAYLAVGDREAAYKTFVDLYGIDTNYRDVVARLEELGPR